MKDSTSSENPTATKCLSGILRSLLCTGSIPTHPSDQLINMEPGMKQVQDQILNTEKSSESDTTDHKKRAAAISSNPGVVARLMGLDSLPVNPSPKTLGSYFRSRSVNSIDFLARFDPVKQQACHCRHRRVRTSVSFREVPSLLVDDKFSVVFPLEEVDETAECTEQDQPLVTRKTNVIYQKGKKMEIPIRGQFRNGEKIGEIRTANKKRPSKKMETEEGKFQSRKKNFNGKTFSVNLKEKKAVDKKTTLESKERRPIMKEVKKKKGSDAKKIHPEPTGKAVSKETCLSKHSSSQKRKISSCSVIDNGEVRPVMKSDHKEKSENECINMLEEICRLAGESVDEINCEWVCGQILELEDFEDICYQFGQEILEFLLIQIVDELVLLRGTKH